MSTPRIAIGMATALLLVMACGRQPDPPRLLVLIGIGVTLGQSDGVPLSWQEGDGERIFSNAFAVNPKGCWNWWGYAHDDRFALKDGVQVGAIYGMIRRIMGADAE